MHCTHPSLHLDFLKYSSAHFPRFLTDLSLARFVLSPIFQPTAVHRPPIIPHSHQPSGRTGACYVTEHAAFTLLLWLAVARQQ
jgi:hypothetical protein